jgi:hypothetical protein
MHQSQLYSPRLQQIKEGNPANKIIPVKNRFHEGSSATKKLVFVWETGRTRILYYSDLIDIDYDPDTDPNALTVYLIYRTVRLKGYNLDRLVARFVLDEPFIIGVTPERYVALAGDDRFVVTDVVVEK